VWFIHPFYPIFKFTAALGQFLRNSLRVALNIATDCGGELYELTEAKFVNSMELSKLKTNETQCRTRLDQQRAATKTNNQDSKQPLGIAIV
jgi:hypothetical protein